jgi:P27 family predicted phage terminase small subunit
MKGGPKMNTVDAEKYAAVKAEAAERVREFLGERYEESDDELIEIYAETYSFYRRLVDELAESKLLMPHTNKAGAKNLVKNPLAIEVTKTVQTLNNLLKSLGLTAAQRKAVAPNGDQDDFESF